MGVDPNPENFGNSSGVALKYLYSLLELKAGMMETQFRSGFDKELNEVYLRLRISRLQALQTQIELWMAELFGSQRNALRDHLQGRYTDTYYRTVYAVSQQVDVASTFARLDPQAAEKIIAAPWLGSEFSSRIWADKDRLTRELTQALSRSLVRSDSLERMTKEFVRRMDVSESRAATLIH